MDDRSLASTGPLAPRVLRSSDPLEGEKVKANLAHESSHRLELLKSVVSAGDSGFKTLLVINGGAAIALLAFLGNVLGKDTAEKLHVGNLKSAMLRFAAGVALVGVGAVLRYTSLYAAMLRRSRPEFVCAVLAFSAGVGSLFAFVLGTLWVVGGVK